MSRIEELIVQARDLDGWSAQRERSVRERARLSRQRRELRRRALRRGALVTVSAAAFMIALLRAASSAPSSRVALEPVAAHVFDDAGYVRD